MNIFKQQINNNRGITLLALIITVIVLIIITSVSISFFVKDNGLFEKASDAKDKSNYRNIYNELNMRIIDLQDNSTMPITLKEIASEIKDDVTFYDNNNDVLNFEDITNPDILIVSYKGYYFKIEKSLKVTKYEQNS